MEDVYLDKDKRIIYGSVGEVNRTSPRSNIFEYIMEAAQLTQLIRSAESSTGPILR